MEGGKQQSGSSLASDLFGAKDSSAASSSSEIFSSIFAPAPKGLGHESIHSSETEKKNHSKNPSWNANPRVSEKNAVASEYHSRSTNGSYYQEQKVQPFHYSSSIYYGGQDVYSQPQDPHNPGSTTFSKDGGEDDPGSASRGNWWQGGPYY